MTYKFIDFKNQVCVITGAGSPTGIGFNTARILGQLGGKIAIIPTTDRIHQRAVELTDMGITAKGYIADLMDRNQVRSLLDRIVSDLGYPSVLINNARLVQTGSENEFSNVNIVNMDYESWDLSISRNLTLCFNVTKETLPYMIKKQYGRIVNVSSVTGPVVSSPGQSGYSAAKAGILGMSRALAIEVGNKNITVNSVLPGWIATASQSAAGVIGGKNTPLKRSADAEEVANAIVFLASRKASYITGEALIVDGGNSIQEYKGPSEHFY